MLLAFGVGTVLALLDRDLDRLELAAAVYTVFGTPEMVVLLMQTDVVRWDSPATYGYLALTASTVLSGAYAVRLTREATSTRERATTRPRASRGWWTTPRRTRPRCWWTAP